MITPEEIEKAMVSAVPETVAIGRMLAGALTFICDALEASVAPGPAVAEQTSPKASAGPTEPAAPSASGDGEESPATSVETPGVFLGEG